MTAYVHSLFQPCYPKTSNRISLVSLKVRNPFVLFILQIHTFDKKPIPTPKIQPYVLSSAQSPKYIIIFIRNRPSCCESPGDYSGYQLNDRLRQRDSEILRHPWISLYEIFTSVLCWFLLFLPQLFQCIGNRESTK